MKAGDKVMIGESGPYDINDASHPTWCYLRVPPSVEKRIPVLWAWVSPVPEPKPESDGDLLARLGTNATKWGEEFTRRFAGHTVASEKDVIYGWPGSSSEPLVTQYELASWFANAIGAGESNTAGSHLAELEQEKKNVNRFAAEADSLRRRLADAVNDRDVYRDERDQAQDALFASEARITTLEIALAELRDDFARIKQIAAQHSAMEFTIEVNMPEETGPEQ